MPPDQLADADAMIEKLLAQYASTLHGAAAELLSHYSYVHLARKVVGVGSVGTRALIVLMRGSDDDGDPLFLQVKEAQPSVLEPTPAKSRYRRHGRRVVEGQWRMQAAGDIFLGWLTAQGVDGVERDFYVRQLWDWKTSADVDAMTPEGAARVRPGLRVDPRQGTRAHGRPLRDRGLCGQGRVARPGHGRLRRQVRRPE